MELNFITKKEILKKNKKTGELVEITTESLVIDDGAVKVVDKFVNKLTDKLFEKIDTNKICDTVKSICKD